MIGERLESYGHVPWGALVPLAAGLGLAVVGLVSGIGELVVGSVLPLAIAGSIGLLGHEPPITTSVREEGLEVEGAGEPHLIAWEAIWNIKVDGRPADPAGFRRPTGAIAILHEGGVVRIPPRLNVPTHEVLRFLAARVPESGSPDVNPALGDYLRSQRQFFGPSSVATFRAASRLLTGSRRGYRAFCIGLLLAGAVWAALGFSALVAIGWGIAGVACLVAGAILYAASFAESLSAMPALRKKWKDASLVIGPHGMAMVQGDIQGEVRWPEVLEVRFQPKPKGFHFGQHAVLPGIVLRVKGASILIADIYDRPLYVIHDRILASSGRSGMLDE